MGYTLLPRPDSMAILVITFLTGKEERQRLMRRNIIRYVLLSYCMATKVSANKWFLPLVWASDICARALAEGKIRPQTVKSLIGEICNIREKLTGIMNHDWVSVPLVYTQTVTLAVYSYFTAALIGAQWINPSSDEAYKAAHGIPVTGAGAR